MPLSVPETEGLKEMERVPEPLLEVLSVPDTVGEEDTAGVLERVRVGGAEGVRVRVTLAVVEVVELCDRVTLMVTLGEVIGVADCVLEPVREA